MTVQPASSDSLVGSSCGTLGDGLAFVEQEMLGQKYALVEDEEEELQRQLEDPSFDSLQLELMVVKRFFYYLKSYICSIMARLVVPGRKSIRLFRRWIFSRAPHLS